MRCSKAREMLALYVGGDLPGSKASRLEVHLESCPECSAELEALRRPQAAIEEIGAVDIAENLPADFADQVFRIANTTAKAPTPGKISRTGFQRLRPVVIIGAVAVLALIAISVTRMGGPVKIDSLAQWRMDLIRSVKGNGKGVAWEGIPYLADVFEKPVRVDQFDPPREAGVFAVMHRIESEGELPRYIIDYCGESRRLGPFTGNPWVNQSKGRLLSRAGSEENIYIAVMLMPDSTRKYRRNIESVLIEAFNPYFNRVKGA